MGGKGLGSKPLTASVATLVLYASDSRPFPRYRSTSVTRLSFPPRSVPSGHSRLRRVLRGEGNEPRQDATLRE